jgi:tetratricopeptide (TPR) repeat protein
MPFRPALAAGVLLAFLLPGSASPATSFECSAKGGTQWQEYESEHAVLRTDLSPDRAGEMVRDLELAWAAVLHAMFAKPPNIPGQIHAIAFASDSDFWAVSPDHAAAYVTSIDGFTPTVVLPGTLKAGTRTTLIHELTHHLSSFPLLRKPMWLDEGFAVYLSSMGSVALGARMTVGSVPEMMLVPRKRSERILVKDLLAWKRIEPGWVGETIRRYYVSSWFLVHYLVNKQTPAFYELFRRLGRAEDPRLAWKAAFPKWDPDVPDALDDLESALDTYGRGQQFQYHELDLRVSPKVTTGPLSSAEVHAIRAVLLPIGGESRPEALRAEVDEALGEDPGNPLALAVLAGLDPRGDNLARARTAVRMHAADWRAWSVLGDALAAGPVAERLQARRKEAELAPAEPVALYELARDLARAGEPQEAAPHALQLLRIAPYAPQTHETVALVAMKLGICADAVRAQQRAIDTLSDRASPKARAEKEKVLADYQRQCAAPPPAAPPSP